MPFVDLRLRTSSLEDCNRSVISHQTKGIHGERDRAPCPRPAGETMAETREEKPRWLQPAPSWSLSAPPSVKWSSALLENLHLKMEVLIPPSGVILWKSCSGFGKLSGMKLEAGLGTVPRSFSFSSLGRLESDGFVKLKSDNQPTNQLTNPALRYFCLASAIS